MENSFTDLISSLSSQKYLSPSFIWLPGTETLIPKHRVFLFQNLPLLENVWEVYTSQLLKHEVCSGFREQFALVQKFAQSLLLSGNVHPSCCTDTFCPRYNWAEETNYVHTLCFLVHLPLIVRFLFLYQSHCFCAVNWNRFQFTLNNMHFLHHLLIPFFPLAFLISTSWTASFSFARSSWCF